MFVSACMYVCPVSIQWSVCHEWNARQRFVLSASAAAISEISFAELVSAHPELLWNRLHALFYSDDVMFSPEGTVLIMHP